MLFMKVFAEVTSSGPRTTTNRTVNRARVGTRTGAGMPAGNYRQANGMRSTAGNLATNRNGRIQGQDTASRRNLKNARGTNRRRAQTGTRNTPQ